MKNASKSTVNLLLESIVVFTRVWSTFQCQVIGGTASQSPVHQRPEYARLQPRPAAGQRPAVSRAAAVTATGALICIYLHVNNDDDDDDDDDDNNNNNNKN